MTGDELKQESSGEGRGLFEREHWPATTSNMRGSECSLFDHETDAWHCRKRGRGLLEAYE